MSEASTPPRDAHRVLVETQGLLTLRATEALYDEQPNLWARGEQGRKHTFDDFGHHFRSLATLDADVFAGHVRYCNELFTSRGFPRTWLTDAWRIMREVLERELPAPVAGQAVEVVQEGVRRGESLT